ncbi:MULTISPECIES: TIGR03620 family F420-dependent LLM class oxidoreductase [unclassified Microbacterium]|uniref:TIGR03620 family F420-dependent LLM class oxidoreductase n=1 Tax=unclassified Microbacterium TaxID=2609290 RepID=UPI00214AB694|nr:MULTISPECIES: TIGR03620 family F420-dependent LLM class oxidoreductase [unclassified Microbacterium]MCR2810556.1 TIGR03620 family F420-dependent LLM class oxidoreductase [Microbacterium sp. zg.B185]WIM19542.1 TIGR03620 family F420-dependent LLM class oxidoreductase [Microbacterium sp. zg-B185]
MTTSSPTKRTYGRVGVWRSGPLLTPELAAAIERLGYGTVWIGGSPDADLAVAETLLDATGHLRIATGIVNIWKSPAVEVAASFHRLEKAHPGRFTLGIGIGHREALGDRYQKPYAALVAYLDTLDAEGVPVDRRVISALGPRTLELAAARSAGTHPYMTTATHTRFARGIVGPDALVAPEQRLIANTDVEAARAAARTFLSRYLSLSNYRRTLESHGFTAADLDDGATDEAVDALVPHGAPAVLAAAVHSHLDAGADHVCVQMLPAQDDPMAALTSLAGELGLR